MLFRSLLASFSTNVASNPQIADEVQAQVQTRLSAGGSFVAAPEVEAAAPKAGLEEEEVSEVVSSYEDAQLEAL